jgi:transposase
MENKATRFIGLDIHKAYFVAVGVNAQREVVFGPRKVSVYQLESWVEKHLKPEDAVVLEATTNAYLFHDVIRAHVGSVTVVHPPHVSLVTRVPVKTDQKAALALAQLHAVGLLTGIWIPPQKVRDLRALIAQRGKMVRLSTIAKNRLHALLQRKHLRLPEKPFADEQRSWWESLPLTEIELMRVYSDLDTLAFARQQLAQIEDYLKRESAQDERIPLLVQLPGVGWLTAITILAAIGDVTRFENAKKLVGYAGLGSRVHDSGTTHTTGRITKAGRRDLRRAMVNAANHAVEDHPHWKKELTRLEPRMGRSKAVVAVARKLLVTVWHVLTKEQADRFAEPQGVGRTLLAHAYRVFRSRTIGPAEPWTRHKNCPLGFRAPQSAALTSAARKRVSGVPSRLALLKTG